MGPGLTRPKEGNQQGFSIRVNFKYRGAGGSLLKPQKCLNSNQTSVNPISYVLFGAMHVKALNLGRK